RARSSSVTSFMELHRLKQLAGLFELLKLATLAFELLFHLGDLGLELFGLFENHLDRRFLLPRFAVRLGRLLRARRGCFRIVRFGNWHSISPFLLSTASVGLPPTVRASGWLRASPAALCGCKWRGLESPGNGP